MKFINNFINSYIILNDFNHLLNLFTITTDDIRIANKKNILNKKLKQVENIKKNSCGFSKPKSTENIIKEEDKDTITEQSLNTEKSENTEVPKVINTIESNNENNPKTEDNKSKENNNTVYSFRDYFVYKITFGKKYKDLEIFEAFRKNIISVEHLMHNYLKLNNLLTLEKRRSKTNNSKSK